MQLRKLLLVIATAAFGVTFASASASAASRYNVTFDRPAVVAGVELKPGDYRVTVDGDKVTISSGKQTAAEAGVAVHTEDRKFSSTSVRYETSDGKNNVTLIRLGGTNQVLEFSGQASAGGSSKPDSTKSGGAVRNSAK